MTEETDQKKAQIREVATRLAGLKGYNGTSMREIADELGINIATLYYYYKDKNQIFGDVLVSAMLNIVQGIERASKSGITWTQRFEHILDWEVEYNCKKTNLNAEVRFIDEPQRSEIIRLRDEAQSMVEGVISAGIKAGEFRELDVKLMAYLVFALGYHVSSWYKPGGRLSIAQIAAEYKKTFLAALRPD
jgi:AcrR family transcriptional regulator